MNCDVHKNCERKSGIECLRIVCIAAIFLMHIGGGYVDNIHNRIVLLIIDGICNIDITVFVLISGFYGIRYTGKRLIRFHNILWFYSIITYVITSIISCNFLGEVKSIFSVVFPVITGGRMNFMSHYFCLMLLAPYLNQIVDNLRKQTIEKLIWTLFILFSAIPTILIVDIFENQGKGIEYMLYIYILGRYLGKYHQTIQIRSSVLLLGVAVFWMVNVILNLTLSYICNSYRVYYSRDCSMFILLEAILVFYIFNRFEIKSHFINFIAGACLGALKSQGIAKYVISLVGLANINYNSNISIMLFVNCFLSVFVAFIFEIIRQVFFGRVFEYFTDLQYKIGKSVKCCVFKAINLL